jgi:hypothetical protein
MIVSELIDRLSQVDGDLPVVLTDEDFEGEGSYVSLAFVFDEAES